MAFNPQPKPSQKAGAKPKKPSALKSKPKSRIESFDSLDDLAKEDPEGFGAGVQDAKAAKKGHGLQVGDKLAGAIGGTVIAVSRQTKGAMIQAMLSTPGGATSKELEAATGWQPHSVRGYLGTMRKAGIKVISKKLPKEPTIYRIEAAAETQSEVL